MCRNIRVLHHFEPPTTDDEIRAAALQYVRKVSGLTKPTLADLAAFERAVDESDGRPLRPWLIRIAHNLAANLYRDRARRPQTPIDDTTMLSAVHTTEDLVEGRDELSRILEGIDELPDDRREALIMRFALGMDNREIARAMGRSDGATKVLIHRAIKQLEEIVNVRQAGRR